MIVMYCTTLEDAYFFLNQSKGLPEISSSFSIRQRYLRACIIFSWIALEEMLESAIEDLIKRKILSRGPRGGLWDRIKAALVARGIFSPDQKQFLKSRKVRNLLTHGASAEIENHLLTPLEAQTVFDYCLKTIRELCPYKVDLRA